MIEKIREEIATRKLSTMDEHMKFYNETAKSDYEFLCRIEAVIGSHSEEPASEGLEEELNNWRHQHFHGRRDKDASGEYLERESQLNLAHHFANWQKEQMTKDVVLETAIIRNDDGCAEDGNYSSWLEYEENEITKMPKWAKEGDKVKLIAIKEG